MLEVGGWWSEVSVKESENEMKRSPTRTMNDENDEQMSFGGMDDATQL